MLQSNESAPLEIEYNAVIAFWFEELNPSKWWQSDHELDVEIGQRFSGLLAKASAGELSHWRHNAVGRLAEIIILDQFSRNIFRGNPDSFRNDPMALVLAQEAVSGSFDKKVEIAKRSFFYMPYMHSESRVIHKQAVELFSQPGLENSLQAEINHKAIIDQFGRYPHRNNILGRTSTQQELEFLKMPNSSF